MTSTLQEKWQAEHKKLEKYENDIIKLDIENFKEKKRLAKEMVEDVILPFLSQMTFADIPHNKGIDNGKKIKSGLSTSFYFRLIDGVCRLLDYRDNALAKDPDISKFCRLFFHAPVEMGCACCGHSFFSAARKDMTVRPLEELTCRFPDGIKDISFTIEIMSGKMVVANDFREFFNDETRDIYHYAMKKYDGYDCVNSGFGTLIYADFMAQQGLGYISTGNSCPTVSKDENTGQIIVHRFMKDSAMVKLGSVCTDLWAVQLVDYDLLKEKSELSQEDFEEYLKDNDAIVIEVPAGVYKFTDHGEYPWPHGDQEMELFGTIEYVRNR